MQHQYSPMQRPKQVSQERLNEIMARRGKINGGSGVQEPVAHAVTPSPDGAKPSPTPAANSQPSEEGQTCPQGTGQYPIQPRVIQWEPAQKCHGGVYVRISSCRRYSIHASRNDKGGWLYHSYRRTEEWNNYLGITYSKEASEGLCEEHLRQHQEGA